MDIPDQEAKAFLDEWNRLFCQRCGWNLKGMSPHRYCTHCDYEEEGKNNQCDKSK